MNLLNLKIDEYTTPTPLTMRPSDLASDALKLMQDKNIRHLPVSLEGEVVGMISQRDLLGRELEGMTLEACMKRSPYTVFLSAKVHEVAFEMSQRKIGSALVLNDDQSLYGIFTTTDALNALIETLRGDLSQG